MEFWTLDDFNVQGKTVFIRVDINSPLDPDTLKIIDISRIQCAIPTLTELHDKGAKTVILAHQGRPGSWDFIPLKHHGEILQKELQLPVQYVQDIYGGTATHAIQSLAEGDILLLENVRQYEGEQDKKSAEDHARSPLITSLAPLGDLFVNDAFAAAHRSHCSLVGFTSVLPSCAGRLLEKELRTLTGLLSHPQEPSVAILGGAKYGSVVKIMTSLLSRNAVTWILLTGVPGLVFLSVQGRDIGEKNDVSLKDEEYEAIKRLLSDYGDHILLPCDFAVEVRGKRREIGLTELPPDQAIWDIGTKTIAAYQEKIMAAKTIFLSGPPGVFEKKPFRKGTQGICSSVADSPGFSIIGGGHTVAAFTQLGISDKVSYVSTGGGALERFIIGEKLPVVEALRANKLLYKDSH